MTAPPGLTERRQLMPELRVRDTAAARQAQGQVQTGAEASSAAVGSSSSVAVGGASTAEILQLAILRTLERLSSQGRK